MRWLLDSWRDCSRIELNARQQIVARTKQMRCVYKRLRCSVSLISSLVSLSLAGQKSRLRSYGRRLTDQADNLHAHLLSGGGG